jgi:hypothetical protein
MYVPDAVLLTVAGDHVPLIPLFEMDGKIGETEPLHIALGKVKVGVVVEEQLLQVLEIGKLTHG